MSHKFRLSFKKSHYDFYQICIKSKQERRIGLPYSISICGLGISLHFKIFFKIFCKNIQMIQFSRVLITMTSKHFCCCPCCEWKLFAHCVDCLLLTVVGYIRHISSFVPLLQMQIKPNLNLVLIVSSLGFSRKKFLSYTNNDSFTFSLKITTNFISVSCFIAQLDSPWKY